MFYGPRIVLGITTLRMNSELISLEKSYVILNSLNISFQ